MNLITHFLSGAILAYFAFPKSWLTLVLVFIFSILPDMDGFWTKALYKHHRRSVFHAPLFWIFIAGIAFLINYFFNLIPNWIIYLFLSMILLHLLTDTITGRTAGVRYLYPFSKKEFTIYKRHPFEGDFKPLHPSERRLKHYLRYYMQNQVLLAFEILVTIVGIIFLIFFIRALF